MFELLIADCPFCKEYFDDPRTILLTGSVREQDLSVAAPDSLLDAIREWKAGRPIPPDRAQVREPAAPSAVAA